MSAEEFWHGEPRLAVSYREAEKLKREIRYMAEWRAGYYVYRAVAANLNKEAEYPSEPLFSNMLDDELVREEKEKAEMEKMMAMFTARAASINKKLAEQGEQGETG